MVSVIYSLTHPKWACLLGVAQRVALRDCVRVSYSVGLAPTNYKKLKPHRVMPPTAGSAPISTKISSQRWPSPLRFVAAGMKAGVETPCAGNRS